MLLEEFLEPLGVTQTELAERMEIPFQRVNSLVNGRRSITPDTALRLAKVFETTRPRPAVRGSPSEPAIHSQIGLARTLRSSVVWWSEQFRRGRFGAPTRRVPQGVRLPPTGLLDAYATQVLLADQ